MTPLWNALLRADLPSDLLDEVHYAVFGLGDSAYEKFCWPAKKLSRRLDSLGATAICARGEGDTQHALGCVA
jgi:sulfite reductase alpha subunit-like flavoprotein